MIASCKGCQSKHLIADNLGSGFASLDTKQEVCRTIEDYAKDEIMVNRVGKDVFDLDFIWHFDTMGGSLVGDDGKPVLE